MSTGTSAEATPDSSAAQVTVTFTGLPQDEIITLDESGNLSKPNNDSFIVSVDGSFSAYQWFLDGVPLTEETGSSLTLSVGSLEIKQHEVTVFVTTTGGARYAKALYFTVTY